MEGSFRPGRLTSERLRAGDVVLLRENNSLSWAIRRFDRSDVGHATIVLESGDYDDAIFASPSAGRDDFACVRRLRGDAVGRMQGELARTARGGLAYSHQQIVLLATLSLRRSLPLWDSRLRRLLRPLLDYAAELVDSLVDRGRSLVIGSDLAYRRLEELTRSGHPLEITERRERSSTRLGPLEAELGGITLMAWAMGRPEPPSALAFGVRSTLTPEPETIATSAERDLAPLIESFARPDDPMNPFVPSDPPVSPRGVGPSANGFVSDDALHVAAIRFRDALNRSEHSRGASAGAPPKDAWVLFRSLSDYVTAGDLRRSPSFETVATLRPYG